MLSDLNLRESVGSYDAFSDHPTFYYEGSVTETPGCKSFIRRHYMGGVMELWVESVVGLLPFLRGVLS